MCLLMIGQTSLIESVKNHEVVGIVDNHDVV